MNPADTLLIFVEPKIGAPFGLALTFGLALACGIFLLRPWPPSARRAVMFVVVLAVCGSAAFSLLRNREVQIDTAQQQVRESVAALGWGRARTWGFAEVRAVVVERQRERTAQGGPRTEISATEVVYRIGLQTADRWIELRSDPDVLVAEAEARQIASGGRWTALRRGYRLETSTMAGETGRFETADGRQGTMLEVAPVARVIVAPDEESPIGG